VPPQALLRTFRITLSFGTFQRYASEFLDSMYIRVLQQPQGGIDGVSLSHFHHRPLNGKFLAVCPS
jgi:hypothetical protein